MTRYLKISNMTLRHHKRLVSTTVCFGASKKRKWWIFLIHRLDIVLSEGNLIQYGPLTEQRSTWLTTFFLVQCNEFRLWCSLQSLMLLENWNLWGFFLLLHIQSVVTLPAGINSSMFPRREQEEEDKKTVWHRFLNTKKTHRSCFWLPCTHK